jgi:hypothetical protein
MARHTALLALSAVLLVCLTLVLVVRSTHGQEAAGSVRGFPFLHVGQTYSMGPYEFQILQDFGNGWVAARGTLGSSALMCVNLYQTPVLFPRDERGAASRPGAVGPWPQGASNLSARTNILGCPQRWLPCTDEPPSVCYPTAHQEGRADRCDCFTM